MTEPGKPLFLARRSYRRRRLVDASRLVPLFGGVLMLVPLLWGAPNEGSLAVRGLFIFVSWGVLVILSAVLAGLLSDTSELADRSRRTPAAGPTTRNGARDVV